MALGAASRVAANVTGEVQPLHSGQKGGVKKGDDIKVIAALNTMNEPAVINKQDEAVASTRTLSQRFFARITGLFCCGANKAISDDIDEKIAKTNEQIETASAPGKVLTRRQQYMNAMKATSINLSPETEALVQNDAQRLVDNLAKVKDELDPHKNPSLFLSPEINRFNDIYARKDTKDIAVPAGSTCVVDDMLNANRIMIAGKILGIASQYPTDLQIPRHLLMCLTNKVTCLLVLTSPHEIETGEGSRQMTDYFSLPEKQSGNISTRSIRQEKPLTLPKALVCYLYDMEITDNDNGKKHSMTVLHAQNWPDRTAAEQAGIRALAKEMLKYDSLLVHCTAGVGRTGVMMAARIMEDRAFDHLSLEEIITELRNQRNGHMVQTDAQLQVLIAIAEKQGRPLLKHPSA